MQELRVSLKLSEEDYQSFLTEIEELKNSPKLGDVFKQAQIIEEMINKAKDEIQNITDEQLEEIRCYKSPPARIKLALEAMFLLLEGKVLTWDVIVKKMSND